MAIKPNENLDNEHIGFIGSSGSGKTYKVKQMLSKNKQANALIFDAEEVYTDCVSYARTYTELAGLVRSAIGRGVPFRYGYSGDIADFEKFCALAWASASGDDRLFVVFEEAGAYLDNSVSLSGSWYRLITVGRKYGVTVACVTQRPQNMNKVIYDMLSRLWVGFSTGRAAGYLERDFSIDMSKIKNKSFSYFSIEGGETVLRDKNDKPV